MWWMPSSLMVRLFVAGEEVAQTTIAARQRAIKGVDGPAACATGPDEASARGRRGRRVGVRVRRGLLGDHDRVRRGVDMRGAVAGARALAAHHAVQLAAVLEREAGRGGQDGEPGGPALAATARALPGGGAGER